MKTRLLMGASLIATAAAFPAAAGGQWEGSYLGVSAGYGEDRARYEDPDFDWYGSTMSFYPKGAVYGVQGGHNWQDLNSVWGLEVDFLGTSIERTQVYDTLVTVPNEVNWLATVRPRAGIALGDTFIYHTVGLAAGDFERSWSELGDPNDSWPDLGDTKWGVAGGFGVERAVGGNWSVRAEAQALRFFQDTSPLNVRGFAFEIDDTIYTFKAGVNYAFGDRSSGGRYVQGQPFDFSGPFIGVSLGGHMATVQLTDIEYDWYGNTYDLLSNGLAGAIQGGFNRQTNGLVYGLEGSFNFFGGDDNAADDFGCCGDAFISSSMNWAGHLTFKAGAAADNTLMYLTAGYAFADYDILRDSGDLWDVGGTHSGFVVGTGIEHAFTPVLTGRVEATYSGFGGDTVASPTESDRFRGAAQDVAVMAGVNYYLGERSMGTGALAPAKWAGLYAGLDGLFAYHHGAIWDRDYDDHGGTYDVPSFGAGAGVHIGHDWQSDSFVYGAIADFAFFTNDEDDTSPGYRSISSSLNWRGTLRGRAGVATGEALFYATGGLAYGDADLDYDYLPAPDPDSFHFDSSRFGWVVGLGVEKAMSDRSSLKFETLYTSFGEEIARDGDTCGPITDACAMVGYDDTVTVTFGYSWRWQGLQ